MRKFVKGNLHTVVDDNDRRVADYIASGWTEVALDEPKSTPATEVLEKALKDANESEPAKIGKKRKAGATDKKVNAAIKANTRAAAQSEPIDDGLIKGGK
jgi:hypothetical protein